MHIFPNKLILVLATFAFFSLGHAQTKNYVTINNGRFCQAVNHQTVTLNGMKMWYAPLLGTKGKPLHKQKRLRQELDYLQALGVNTLTILAGAQIKTNEATDTINNKSASLHTFSTNQATLQGIDFCLKELEQRGMKAIVALSYDWKQNDSFNHDYADFTKTIVDRYRHSGTILSWQLCEAPSTINRQNVNAYNVWCQNMAKWIKQTDSLHLVNAVYTPLSLETSEEQTTFGQFVSKANLIDYYVIELSPYKLHWVNRGTLFDALAFVYVHTNELLETYNRILQNRNIPFVAQVAYPRDGAYTGINSSTNARNEFFTYMASLLQDAPTSEAALQGLIVNGWGGTAQPKEGKWIPTEEFTAEYPNEKTGQYSIFLSDSTTTPILKLIYHKK